MFFSIIVPTYNPLSLISPLLDSITHNYCSNDIEVILADDLSTEPFEEILEQYPHLNIKIIENDQHYGFPRWGRQNGLDHASGDWVCFADQDDYFEDSVFDNIRQFIQQNDIHNYIETDLILAYSDSNIKKQAEVQRNMTHGKFYEKKFLIENNIFYDEVKSGEDVNFQTKVVTTLFNIDGQMSFFNQPSYDWVQRPDSLSKTKQGANSLKFFFTHYIDYVKGQCGYYISNYRERLKKNLPINKDYYKTQLEYFFIFAYCYLTAMEHKQNQFEEVKLEENYDVIKQYYHDYLQLFDMTTDKYLDLIYTEKIEAYSHIYAVCAKQYSFIPKYSFYDWVKQYLDQ